MAQLVARLVRNEKVGGSNPPSSTEGRHPIRMSVFCMPGRCCGGALLWCRWCSGRRRARPPARLPHASLRLGVVDLEARPCPPDLPAPHTGGIWCTDGVRSPARPRHRPPALRPGLQPVLRLLWLWSGRSLLQCLRGGPECVTARRVARGVQACVGWAVAATSNLAFQRLACEFRQFLSIRIKCRPHFVFLNLVHPTGWLFHKSEVMGLMLYVAFRDIASECGSSFEREFVVADELLQL